MLNMPGGSEIIIILIVVLLLFGGKKIPELARGLGKGIREFKDGMKQVDKGVKEHLQDGNDEDANKKKEEKEEN
jgi:sec-independent protein translocase protein TatA